uniref:Transposase n=1 Tax=Streptomyces sp. NBC_01393 TaxID=2903851 RepID=A0AAU3I2H5_9ACTN
MELPTIMEILRHTRIGPTRYIKSRSYLGKAPRRTGDTFAPAPRNLRGARG